MDGGKALITYLCARGMLSLEYQMEGAKIYVYL